MKNIHVELEKQAKEFVQKVCFDTWGMSDAQVKTYCLMIVKQNVLMAKLNPDYFATAVAYAPLTGLAAKEIEHLLKGGETK